MKVDNNVSNPIARMENQLINRVITTLDSMGLSPEEKTRRIIDCRKACEVYRGIYLDPQVFIDKVWDKTKRISYFGENFEASSQLIVEESKSYVINVINKSGGLDKLGLEFNEKILAGYYYLDNMKAEDIAKKYGCTPIVIFSKLKKISQKIVMYAQNLTKLQKVEFTIKH